jgi:plastocyanin
VTLLGKDGTRPATDAVVYVESVPPSAWRLRRPRRAGEARVTMKDKTFAPHVLPVLVGEEIDFPNLDPVFHNVFSLSAKNKFDLGLYKDGTSKKWKAVEPGVVRVFCNIHSSMTAYLVVLQNPYFASPGEDGAFRIADLPPGPYKVTAWDERGAPDSRTVEVEAGGTATVDFQLDARGYKELPHKNKFGREYEASGY